MWWFSQLGKEQEYQLGQWLRERYATFLPADYSETDIRVRSTDVDRTLMSGEACLAGLYPPTPKQLWDQNLKWQPIPIHTLPEVEDAVLAMKKPCPRYNALMRQLLKSDEFIAINHKLHDLYAYLTKYTGTLIADIINLEYVYNTLYIESVNNFTLPDWTKSVFPEKLKPWAAFSFAVDCYTPPLARLKTGPLFHEIQQHFLNFTSGNSATPKFLLYSAHDMTVASVLQTIGAFEYHSPPYSSSVLFELRRRSNDSYYLNAFYKNTSVPQKIHVAGCDFDCDYEKFVQLLQPIALSVQQWEVECNHMGLMALLPFSTEIGDVVVLSCGVLMVLILGVVVVMVRRRNRNRKEESYVRLPDTDGDAWVLCT